MNIIRGAHHRNQGLEDFYFYKLELLKFVLL
jgi:hypothetical protein